MEQVARRALEEADLPEAYLGWMMVMISSEFWKESLAAVPPERRLFLLPHCLLFLLLSLSRPGALPAAPPTNHS